MVASIPSHESWWIVVSFGVLATNSCMREKKWAGEWNDGQTPITHHAAIHDLSSLMRDVWTRSLGGKRPDRTPLGGDGDLMRPNLGLLVSKT